MTKIVPHIVFGIAYFLLGLALAALLDLLLPVRSLQHLSAPAVAPLALLLAQRFGVLSRGGVLVAAVLVAAVSYTAVVAILQAIAASAGGSVAFFAPAQIGGWQFVLDNVLLILSPVVWLHFLGRQRHSMRTGGAA